MKKLADKDAAAYFRRCYTAVDGLWFMKVEEQFGFDIALETDNRVWEVLPKIQARSIREAAGLEDTIDGLREALAIRFELEDFGFSIEDEEDGFTVVVRGCPWHKALEKSGREGLSETIGSRICLTEYTVWASEFGCGIRFELDGQICAGEAECRLTFQQEACSNNGKNHD